MPNLIEQMNILKGLTDEHLQGELQAPSGSAPPFLVASEINRRKDMRQRYEAEEARRAPRTTVIDDLMGGASGQMQMPQQGQPPMGGMPGGMGGLDSAAPAPQRAFASGGIVQATDYNDIASKLNERLSGLTGDTKRAQALALIAAGAGIAGAGHSNTLQNIGIGIGKGIDSYSDQMKVIDSREIDLLRGLTDVAQAQHTDELQRLQQESLDRRSAADIQLGRDRLNFEKTPAAVLTEEWYNNPDTTDAERASFDAHQRAAYGFAQAGDDFRMIEAQARKDLEDQNPDNPKFLMSPAGASVPLGPDGVPDAQALAQAKANFERALKLETYNRIRRTYGEEQAARYALNAGLSAQDTAAAANDALVSGAPPAPGGGDPLGLGL